MATIVDINEYRKRKQHEAEMSKLKEMTNILFTHGPWASMEERAGFMIELSRLSALEESA